MKDMSRKLHLKTHNEKCYRFFTVTQHEHNISSILELFPLRRLKRLDRNISPTSGSIQSMPFDIKDQLIHQIRLPSCVSIALRNLQRVEVECRRGCKDVSSMEKSQSERNAFYSTQKDFLAPTSGRRFLADKSENLFFFCSLFSPFFQKTKDEKKEKLAHFISSSNTQIAQHPPPFQVDLHSHNLLMPSGKKPTHTLFHALCLTT